MPQDFEQQRPQSLQCDNRFAVAPGGQLPQDSRMRVACPTTRLMFTKPLHPRRAAFCSPVVLLLSIFFVWSVSAAEKLALRTNDVVAFVGGADVSAAQFSGYLESLLSARWPGVRFRNFGWEGDTVYEQPRDFGFPPLKEHLRKAGATVILLQFGRSEALEGKAKLPEFSAAYKKLINALRAPDVKLVLVTPPPFESAPRPLPDLRGRNEDLAAYVEAIREIGTGEKLPVIDVFADLDRKALSHRLTEDGLQLTPGGQALLARSIASQLGLQGEVESAGEITYAGEWTNANFERLRRVIIAKNRLWFNYWRPQNWAFLGGDRISQPSSRDYRDPSIRWFPTEIEKFNGLIRAKEGEIVELARKAGGK